MSSSSRRIWAETRSSRRPSRDRFISSYGRRSNIFGRQPSGSGSIFSEEGLRTYWVFNRGYRNRRIGEFLKEMHLIEGRNTGFRKILNALERNGSPKPVFETDPERLSFCTTIPIHPHFLASSGTETSCLGIDADSPFFVNTGAIHR